MATLTRTPRSSNELNVAKFDLTIGIPTPFPTSAEREQDHLLEDLEGEELQLDGPSPDVKVERHEDAVDAGVSQHDVASYSEELLPSIGYVQLSCITTLNDLLSASAKWTPILPDRRHSMPSPALSPSASTSCPAILATTPPKSALHTLVSNLRVQDADGNMIQTAGNLDESDLLLELRARVDRLAPTLPPHDAELARTLASLLSHFHRLSHLQPVPSSAPPRVSSWSALDRSTNTAKLTDPYVTLRRQLSDFQLERSASQNNIHALGGSTALDPVRTVEAALVWTHIDEGLDRVLSLCRSRADSLAGQLPPEYDPADYGDEPLEDHLPEYEAGTYSESVSKTSLKQDATSPQLANSRLSDEKMRMDLEAVTLAIDRLYLVAPQLHNQRVELKQSKVEEMERARRSGKGKGRDGDLQRIIELIGKASDRRLVDQSVVLDGGMKGRIEKARQRDVEKRAAFVEQLASHSNAGRLHSQDASFVPRSTDSESRPRLLPAVQDPHAMLTLPDFLREAVPHDIQRRMDRNAQLDPEDLLTLPQALQEDPPPNLEKRRHSRVLSYSKTRSRPHADGTTTAEGSSTPVNVKTVKRSRSMSEPLSWLLPGSRASSPGGGSKGSKSKSGKLSRPGSSHGVNSIMEETMNVSYVAEYHENLQHILVFLTMSGLEAGTALDAEVVPSLSNPSEYSHLLLRCAGRSDPHRLLSLPAHVNPDKVAVSNIGDYYQIKLSTPSSSKSDQFTHDLLDATHFSSINPTSLICTSCSLPLVHASRLSKYNDLPSEHWAELVDAWMCHPDQTLHEHVKRGSREGFWPGQGEALVGGSYVLVTEDAIVKANVKLLEASKHVDDWQRVRCICGAIVGRCREHAPPGGTPTLVYRLVKYAFRPVSPTAEPTRVPLSAFIVEDMTEFVHAHATYRFVIMDEEEERPRILIWLFKPNMRLAYTTPAQYVIPKSGSIRAAKVLFKIIGPSTEAFDFQSMLNQYPGFPQAEHLYYPLDICARLAVLLKESNTAYPEIMRTMTGLDVGWLQRA